MVNISESNQTEFSSVQRALSLTLGVACSMPLTSLMAMAHAPMPSMTPMVAPGVHVTNQSAVHHTATWSTHNSVVGAHASVVPGGALNLASSTMTYLAGNLANFSSLTIDVGNKQEQVNLNTKLTAAEVVAVEQVILGGGTSAQTIKLGSNGAADGGTVSLNGNLLTALNSSVGGSVSSLTVARGVQVVDSVSNLSLSGSLANYGTISTAAGSSGATDTISANTIVNAASGSINSYSGGGGLVGADPSLNAVTSITNSGNITSAGNLTLSAPVVNNVAAHGAAATISAAQNVNIITQNLNNSGLIAALTGNVNVASSAGLNVSGAGGTIQANNGNVNLSSTNADIDANGGNVLSQQVNFDAGTGNVNASLDQVTGTVNASGNEVQVVANTQNLRVGALDATGDPLIANTGNVVLAAGNPAATVGAPLTIVAGQNIVSEIGSILDTSSTTANGGNLTLIAGATFTGTQATGIVVTKGSATGGIIDLTGGNNTGDANAGPVNSITTKSTFATGTGGAIEMVAFAGKNLGSGAVVTPGAINIDASGTGGNGNVTIIAGAKTGTSIITGNIIGGTVAADAAAPTIVLAKGSKGLGFDTTGAPAPPNTGTINPSKTLNATTIVLGDVNASTALNAATAGSVQVNPSASTLNIGTITVGKTGALTVTGSGAKNIVVSGLITGGSAVINDQVGTGLLTTTGTGSINTTTLSFQTGATAGTNQFATNVSTLSFVTQGSSVSDTQGTLTMAVSGKVGSLPGTVSITSNGQVNVTSQLSVASSSSITITTLATDKGGIAVAAPISVGSGSITLDLQGKGLLTQTAGNPLNANLLTIQDVTNFGSAKVPLATNANTLDIQNVGPKTVSIISDANTGTLVVQDSAVGVGGTLTLTSAASALNIKSANYNTVSVTNTATSGAGIDFTNNTGILGTGAGTFTVVSNQPISDSSGATLKGTTVSLNAAQGVGVAATPVMVATPIIVLNSSTSSVFAQDSADATASGAASLNPGALKGTYSVIDTAAGAAKTGVSLTVGKSIGGGNIDLTTNGATPGNIAVTGLLGTTNTNSVTVTSGLGVSTKGAINGNAIAITTGPGPGVGSANLVVGGLITGSGKASSIDLTSTGAANVNSITVGGILSANTISATSVGAITTTKAISGVGSGSSVTLTGITPGAGANAVTVGGAITGISISLLNTGAGGNIAVNANVGAATSDKTTVDTTAGGGAITGKGVIGGQHVVLNANLGIGTAKATVNTAAVNLSINTAKANVGGTFIAQKGNLGLGVVNTDNLVMKVTGTTDLIGSPINVGAMALTSTGATTVDGAVAGTGAAGSAISITSGGALTVNKTGSLTGNADTLTVAVTGAGIVNGTIDAATTLKLTTTGTFSLAQTGVIGDAAASTDTITAKGAVNISGTLGNASGLDTLALSSGGALTIGFPGMNAKINGATGSTVSGVTIANFGTAQGGLTFNASGSGNAFLNEGTIGVNADSITINAAKGSIQDTFGGNTNAGTLAFNALGAATFTNTGAGLTVSGTAGSITINYANGSSANTKTVTLNNLTAKTGNLTVASNAENLIVNGGTLTTITGNISLQNTNTLAGANINLLTNTVIHASAVKTNLNQGNVFIFMGPSGFTPAAGVTPVVNPPTINLPPPPLVGTVNFGSTANLTGTITTSGATDVLNPTGRNINFNTTSGLPATAITLAPTVTITADPPAGPSASAMASPIVNALVMPAVASGSTVPASSALASGNLVGSSVVAPASFAPASITNPISTTMSLANSAGNANLLAGVTDGYTEANISGLSNSQGLGLTSNTGLAVGNSGGIGILTGAVSNTDTEHRSLERGPLLLLPEKNMTVDTPFGTVDVAANAAALIIVTSDGLAVYNLHDGHSNAVVVKHSAGAVAVNPGRTAVLTRTSALSFADVNPAPFVSYRRVGSKDLSAGLKLYQSEFDLLSMMRGLPQLSHLLKSDSVRTRRTMANIMKTAAILMQVNSGGEAYNMYVPAKTMALLSSAVR